MAATKKLKLRGGTTAEHATFTGHAREVTVDTTKKTLVVHDGITPGGVAQAKASDIPTNTNQLQNDKYHTKTTLTKLSQLTNDAAFRKKTDLTKISQLTNDSGFITGYCAHCTHCSHCTNCS